MICNKTPENDDFTSEIYKVFWSEFKTPVIILQKKFFFWKTKNFSKASSY